MGGHFLIVIPTMRLQLYSIITISQSAKKTFELSHLFRSTVLNLTLPMSFNMDDIGVSVCVSCGVVFTSVEDIGWSRSDVEGCISK